MKIDFIDKRDKGGFWGRWGGGWNYKLGVMVSSHQIFFELIFFGVSITWGKAND